MHIKDVVSCGKFRLKVLGISLFAHRACGRHGASAEHVIKFVGIEFVEVDVGINHLFAHGVRHRDEFDVVCGALLGSDVAIGVAKKCQHKTKI